MSGNLEHAKKHRNPNEIHYFYKATRSAASNFAFIQVEDVMVSRFQTQTCLKI